ncbi:MAG: DUF2232 domain-containing protein [Mariprofundaceae bacterium]|nr:DUF2232 domain-containing protein [Mariprofundaceae bacterium]
MRDTPLTLPAFVTFFLTKHVPCSALLLAMLSSVIWLPNLFMSIPLLAVVMSFVAIFLNALTPALFALIFMGGGLRYSLQVSAIIMILVSVINSSLLLGIVVGGLYALLPIWAASALMREQGLKLCATRLLFALSLAVMLGLSLSGSSQDLNLHAHVDALLAPMFSAIPTDAGALPAEGLAEIRHLLSWSLPGLLAFGLWSAWWAGILSARNFACKYGFYTGIQDDMLSLNLGKPVAYLLLGCLLLANFDIAGLQYIAVNLGLVLAGAMAVQGVSVVHVWLKARDMPMAIAMMYVLLFIWSMMVIPFIVLGLLDIWYDYRRNINPTLGEK